jgi:dTDP-4-dehydrorhamnose reductase
MRILITGAAGQLGTVLSARMRAAGHDVVGVDLPGVDITDHDVVRRVVDDSRPDVIANCAAFTDVDGAEERPLEALEANAFAVRSLAQAARQHDAVLFHYSTDFVFDGDPARTTPYTEEDHPDPQSVYGASKLLGEWLAAAAPCHYIFRLESLFGGAAARSSVDKIIQALRAGREARVFEDRTVTLSYVEDVAAATEAAIGRAIPSGLYHCVNDGAATWLDVAREIARVGGFEPGLLVPVKVADVKLKAKRPQYCALSNEKLAVAGVAMPTWQDVIARYLPVALRRSAAPSGT